MTDSPHLDIFTLFEGAVALDPIQRAGYLQASGAQPEVQARVLAMLRADSSTLDLDHARAGIDMVALLTQDDSTEPPLPTLRGHYRILRQVGQGGAGTVYEAEQTSPRRRVAIKAIRAGLASRRAVQRLSAEADILGRLQHPGIAQVFEAGVGEEDQPDQAFIVMELVEGVPIHRFADEHRLGRRERIGLLLQVCEAVEHAHQRGVIHRDLKPANILVDKHGRTRVLDFGVARLLSTESDSTQNAEHGDVVGTLGYMSPEQAAGRTDAIDVRTDVYALGAMLYELLVGQQPLPVTGVPIADALRMIREQDPVLPGSINSALRGDLSIIMTRALAKDPERRFARVDLLADELRRYLDGRPIQSRSRSAVYTLSRHARTHWILSGLAAMFCLSLLGFSIKAGMDAARYRTLAASEARARRIEIATRHVAERERGRADAANRLLGAELAANEIERARLETRIGNGSAAEAILWPAYFAAPESAAVHGALSELFESHPCMWTAGVPGATRVAMRSNGLIAVGTQLGGVAFLESAEGRLVGVVQPDEDQSEVVAVFPSHADGFEVIQRSGRVRVVSVGAGTIPVATRWIAPNPSAVTCHPGGLLAGAYTDGHIRIYRPDQVGETQSVSVSEQPLFAVAISPDGSMIAASGADAVIRIYSADGGVCIAEMIGHEREVRVLEFDPYRPGELCSMASDQTFRRWTLSTGSGAVEGSFQDKPLAIAIAENGSMMLAESERVWLQAAPGRPIRSVAFPRTAIWDAAILSDAVVTVESGGEIRLWSTRQSPAIDSLRVHRNWVFGIDLSDRHNTIATSSGDGTIRFSDRSGRSERAIIRLPQGVRARCVRFAPDESVLAVGCSDGLVRLYDPAVISQIGELPGPGGEIYAVAFSPDGSRLAGGSWNRAVRVWSVNDGTVVGDLRNMESVPRGLAFSPDGRSLYASGSTHGVLVLDADAVRVMGKYSTAAEPWSIALSPDGRYLATGLFDASVCLIDLESGESRVGVGRHRLVVAGLQFSPNGQSLVSGGDDGSIRVWTWNETGLRTVQLADIGFGPIPVVRFDRDGKLVHAGTSTGVHVTWDLNFHAGSIARNATYAAARYAPPSVPPQP